MADHTACPRCGALDSFMTGYLPETCVCRVCQSQLDWREIPGCGPDCGPVESEAAPEPPAPTYVAAPIAPASEDEDGTAAGECPPAGSDAANEEAGAADDAGDDRWKV